MKRFYLFLFALLSLAAQAAYINVGYFKGTGDTFYAYSGFEQLAPDMKVGAAIRITPDMYAHYLGAKIVGIRIGWADPDNPSKGTIFLRKELNGKDNMLTGSGTLKFVEKESFCGEYITIKFDNPEGLSLTEALGTFYVGYYADNVKQHSTAIATTYPENQPGSAYIWGDLPENYDEDGNEKWEDLNEQAALCIDLVVQGTFNNIVESTKIITYPTMSGAKAEDALLTFKNHGTNSFKKLTFEYNFGDQKKTETLTLSKNVQPGTETTVSIPVWALGDGEHTLHITKIGTSKNTFDDTITYQTTMVPDEVAEQYKRTSLVEFFESENNYHVPQYYDEYFLPGYNTYAEDLNLIAQHIGDQWELGDEDALKLMIDLAGNDSTLVSIPAMSIDRGANIVLTAYGEGRRAVYHNIISPYFANVCYEPHLARPTFASVNVESTVEDDKVLVTVSGNIAPDVLAPGRHLHLTATLVEDGVYTDSQKQGDLDKGEYIHNNLQRICLTDKWGDEIPVESGDFTMTFTTDLYPDEWDLSKMRVVAFVNRTPADGNRWSCDILNSASCPLLGSDTDGIHNLTTDEAQRTAPVYDLQGRRVEKAAKDGGIYIVGGKKVISGVRK